MSWDTLTSEFPWPPEQPEIKRYLHGWAVHESAWHAVLNGRTAPVLLEVGAWTGKTSSWLLTTFAGLRLIAADRWSVEPDQYPPEDALNVQYLRTWWDRFCAAGRVSESDTPLDLYRANLWGFRDRVVAVESESVCAMVSIARHLVPDVVYIDADHHYEAVRSDILAALHLFPGSCICGDDYSDGNGVQRAVEEIASERGFQVTRLGNQRFWVYDG